MTTEPIGDNHVKTARLVERFQQGDTAAFEELYAIHFKHVYFLAGKLLGDTHQAAEVAQDTFESVYKNLDKLESPMAFQKWINTITHNMCMDVFDREKSVQSLFAANNIDEYSDDVLQNEEFLPEQCLSNKEMSEAVSKMIDTLPPAQKEPILLYYFEGLNSEDIASIMNVKPGTVRKRLHDARNALRFEARKLVPSSAGASAAASGLVITQLLAKEADSMNQGAQANGTYAAVFSAVSASKAATTAKAATVAAHNFTLSKTLIAVTTAACISAATLTGLSLLSLNTPVVDGAMASPTAIANVQVDFPRNPPAQLQKSATPQPGEETAQVTADQPAQSNSRASSGVEAAAVNEPLPSIYAGTADLSYPAGTVVPLARILLDANVIAVSANGELAQVTSVRYENIDFNTPGMYPLVLFAKSASGLLSQPVGLTIEIVR